MFILDANNRPAATVVDDNVFIRLRSRNPLSGRLFDCAGFTLSANHSLTFYQHLRDVTLDLISADETTDEQVAKVVKFQNQG